MQTSGPRRSDPTSKPPASGSLNRRTLLARLSALALAAGLPAPLASRASAQPAAEAPGLAPPTRDAFGELLPMRKFGRHDEWVTSLGLGGAHFDQFRDRDLQAAADTLIENGVRFIDTAESYGRGNSETIIGRTLVPKYRDALFIMTKTKGRTADQVRAHLDGSRKRMGVDVIDLWQIHSLQDAADVDRFVDRGGLDFFLEQREKGTVRYLGLTGHVSPTPFNHLLDHLDRRGVAFDAALMPINLVDPQYESFIDGVLPRLVQNGYAVLAMKTLAFGGFFGNNFAWANRDEADPTRIIPDRVSLEEALHFALAHPIASLVSGMNRTRQIVQNAGIARRFSGMTPEVRRALVDRVADAAGESMEFYKEHGVG
ncbi:MAG: aldo/keto reductase [Planctomycetota bacterium]